MRADDDLNLFLSDLHKLCRDYHFVIDEFKLYEPSDDKLYLVGFQLRDGSYRALVRDESQEES